MKETRSISLNGLSFMIDNDAYQALHDYLTDIELRLPQDEKADVMADVEARMGELFQKAIFAKNIQVINLDLVHTVKTQIGNPSDFGENKRPHVKVSKTQNSGCSRILGITLIVLLALFALPVIIPVFCCIFAVIAAVVGISVGAVSAFPFLGPLAGIAPTSFSPAILALFILCALTAIIVPIVMLIHSIVTYTRTRRGPQAKFWIITLIIWVLSLVGMMSSLSQMNKMIGGWNAFGNSFSQVMAQLDKIDHWDEDALLEIDNRTFSAFHSIDITGAMEIDLHPSPNYAVQVESNNLQGVLTEVRDSVLYISLPDAKYMDVDVDIYLPELRSIHGVGACDVETDETFQLQDLNVRFEGISKAKLKLHANTLKVALNGAGKINLEGNVQQADITLAGAGKVESEWLNAQIVHINCAGASQAEIKATQELWAQAAGASKITYIGNPTVKSNIAVGGSVIKKK